MTNVEDHLHILPIDVVEAYVVNPPIGDVQGESPIFVDYDVESTPSRDVLPGKDSFVVCDVTGARSHVLPDAILDSRDADVSSSTPSVFSPASGECDNHCSVVFSTPQFEDVISVDVFPQCIAGTCMCRHYIGSVPCQLKPCRAAQFLFGPGNLDTVSDDERLYLWKGLVNGFEIVDQECPASYWCDNYNSITGDEFRDEMNTLLLEELADQKVSRAASPPRCVHSLGAVKKSNGRLRPITDCSRPDGDSINNFMVTTFRSFSYNSVEDAVGMLCPEDSMAVVDISSAYRSVNVHADHVKYQGLRWDFGSGEEVLTDNRLCFGLRCAPNIFDSLSSFIVKIANSRGASRIVNYLDDFLVVASTPEECLQMRDIVTSVIALLGFEVSWKKVTSPSQVTTFLGITIDSVKMELSLPQEKVVKLESSIKHLLHKGSATKKELECVGGLVSHCSYVVRGGRTFSRRIFDLAASYSRDSKCIPLDESIRADFSWWLNLCSCFNCKACIVQDSHPIPLYSDSSFKGFGAWMGLDWLAGCWSAEDIPMDFTFGCSHLVDPPVFDAPPKNINVLELWPIVAGITRWGHLFANSFVHVITDNMQVLAMLCTGRSANKLCMSWLREIFWMCFIWNIDISPSYIRSADNHLADALSRLPYKGVVGDCDNLLTDLNMCCSHPDRTFNPSPEEAPEDSSRGRLGRIY